MAEHNRPRDSCSLTRESLCTCHCWFWSAATSSSNRGEHRFDKGPPLFLYPFRGSRSSSVCHFKEGIQPRIRFTVAVSIDFDVSARHHQQLLFLPAIFMYWIFTWMMMMWMIFPHPDPCFPLLENHQRRKRHLGLNWFAATFSALSDVAVSVSRIHSFIGFE